MTRWHEVTGSLTGDDYAARFAALAASGADVHGEADFCAALLPRGASVLDAGCGTGRVTIELTRRGYRCVGVDVDASMLRQARLVAPAGTWMEADLARLDLPQRFDLVVAAGNVIPLLTAGTEAETIRRLTDHLLRPEGVLVTGFGLDAEHLPLSEAPFGISAYDAWCISAGLRLVDRFATWQRDRFDDGGYAVSVHRRS